MWLPPLAVITPAAIVQPTREGGDIVKNGQLWEDQLIKEGPPGTVEQSGARQLRAHRSLTHLTVNGAQLLLVLLLLLRLPLPLQLVSVLLHFCQLPLSILQLLLPLLSIFQLLLPLLPLLQWLLLLLTVLLLPSLLPFLLPLLLLLPLLPLLPICKLEPRQRQQLVLLLAAAL